MTDLPYSRRLGRASIKMRVRRSRFLLSALIASLIMTGVLTALALMVPRILEAESSETAVAALLLLPSVLATYVARPGEHLITSRMLRWARFALIGNAALPFLAALAFITTPVYPGTSSGVSLGGAIDSALEVFQQQDSAVHGLEARWAALAVASALFTLLFLISNVWPRPHGTSHYSVTPSSGTLGSHPDRNQRA